ncbi:MAG: macro domain-containing protein, partial [Euryarchaeota archaeon]|nr:macro domain-containing protein [Euryarchaeota archaeon]
NAANTSLWHGGGVAGAIVRKGGRVIQEESSRIGHCPVGGAVVTGAGKLKARYVIHAVGPKMGEGDEDRKLAQATESSLRRAEELAIESIAFPAISTGVYRVPVERCAPVMLGTAIEHLRRGTGLKKVVFCLFSREHYRAFEEALQDILG